MSAWKIVRAWLVRPGSMVVSLLVLSACGGDSPTAPRLTLQHDPIVFVHGYGGTPSDWDLMKSRFKAAGWTDAEMSAICDLALSVRRDSECAGECDTERRSQQSDGVHRPYPNAQRSDRVRPSESLDFSVRISRIPE